MLKINVVGMGYIGTPLALLLAKNGYKVLGTDIDEEKIKKYQSFQINIEPQVNELINLQEVQMNINFSTEIEPSDVFIICVPTPVENKNPNLDYVVNAANHISKKIKKGNLVILESTVPPNTCQKIIIPLISRETNLKFPDQFGVIHCPERALPGNILFEYENNVRIIGGIGDNWLEKAKNIYKSFVKNEIILTTDTSAEFIKLAENSFRDVNIAFANQIKVLASELKLDVHEIISIANKHPRVNILNPGIGVGGHCIPVDPYFLISQSPSNSKLLKAARDMNNSMPEYTTKIIIGKFKVFPKKICIAGISYKPNVSDSRESPVFEIIEKLKAKNIEIVIYDPLVYPNQEEKLTNFVKGCDGMIVTVPHKTIMDELEHHKFEILDLLVGDKIIFSF